jgi:hypothetical protein
LSAQPDSCVQITLHSEVRWLFPRRLCPTFLTLIFMITSSLVGASAAAENAVASAEKAIESDNYAQAALHLDAIIRDTGSSKAHRIWAMQTLGTYLLDGRDAVPADPLRGYKLLSLAALDLTAPSSYAAGALGEAFLNGRGLPRNVAAARRWYGQQIMLGNDGATAWYTHPDTLEQERRYLEARAQWRATKPTASRPFGFVLGYDFPFEQSFEFYKNASNPYVWQYEGVQPPEPMTAGEIPSGGGYSVAVTPATGKVFQVATELTFESLESCSTAFLGYLETLSGATPFRQLGFCKDCRLSSWGQTAGLKLWGDFDGPSQPEMLEPSPLTVQRGSEMVGTRLLAECLSDNSGEEATGKLILQHLPTYEFMLSELVAGSNQVQNWYGKVKERGAPHASSAPFGVRLLAPLSSTARRFYESPLTQLAHRPGDTSYVAISPPAAASVFTEYRVKVSSFGEYVLGVDGYAVFDSRDDCAVTMEATAQEIFEAHARQKNKRFTDFLRIFSDSGTGGVRWRRIEPFYVTSDGLFTSGGLLNKNPEGVFIQLNCFRESATLIQGHTPAEGEIWRFQAAFEAAAWAELLAADHCLATAGEIGCGDKR